MLLHCIGLLLLAGWGSCQTFKATINMAGVTGEVTFQGNGGNTDINVTLSGSPSFTAVQLMSLPAVFGQSNAASAVCSQLGTLMFTFPGMNSSSTSGTVAGNVGDYFHRSVLITGGTTALCATILPVGETILTYRAKFMGPIVGDVWIRKRNSSGALFIFYDLAYGDDQVDPTGSSTVNLVQHSSGSIGSSFATRCDSLTSPSLLSPSLTIGNSVQSSARRQGILFNGADLRLFFALQNASGTTIACAQVHSIFSKTATTTFFVDDVTGSVTMTQASPFDVTTTAVALNGLKNLPVSYHVHKFPVPQRQTQAEELCNGGNVGGHWNPYAAAFPGPATGTGTSDQYEVGDLSGKYSKLTTASVSATYTDWNLPLFGINSVVGRSIVLHRSDSTRWICASIGYPGDVKTAIVRFKSPAYGNIYLRQSGNDGDGDTSVFGELANMNEVASVMHNFHVHQYPVAGSCTTAGPHYNPSGVAVSTSYNIECTSSNPLRCELGDLSSKLGTIDITTSLDTGDSKFFFTDSYLPLSGDLSVIGLSVVVHAANQGAPRHACANITLLHPLKLLSDGWKGNNADGSLSGELQVLQNTEFDPSKVTGTVSGLASSALTYQVMELPIQSSAVSLTQCLNLGQEFNPFNVTSNLATGQTFDKYSVGDLSGKYGSLLNLNSVILNKNDNNLPIQLNVGIAGRPIVVFRSGPNAWKCTNMAMTPADSSGYEITAQVNFADVFVGYIILKQIVYNDGSSSPTSVEVSMLLIDPTATSPNHNWHVHIDPIISQTNCSVAKGHYNPYSANTTSPSYSTVCNGNNQLACEVGDLSRKHGQYTIQPLGRKFFIDEDLPLHTYRTVLGRSIVFHVVNGGAARQTCANILPTSQVYTLAFQDHVAYNEYQFIDLVATHMGINRMRVVVLHNTFVPVRGGGCAKVMIHLVGSVDSAKVDTLLSSGTTPYTPTTKCKSETGAKVIGFTKLTGGAPKATLTASLSLFCALAVFVLQGL